MIGWKLSDALEVRVSDNKFLVVVETLTRIGMKAKGNVLVQSCHILHKQNRYYVMHFRELFALDGKEQDIDDYDLARRNHIAEMLENWGLVEIVGDAKEYVIEEPMNLVVVPHKEKSNWSLKSNYTIGRRNDRQQRA